MTKTKEMIMKKRMIRRKKIEEKVMQKKPKKHRTSQVFYLILIFDYMYVINIIYLF